jgi:cytoskeletal protein CcmA (bactofilin family)
MKTGNKHLKTDANGFVLPLVIVLIIVLFFIGGGLLTLGFEARIQALRNTQDIYARAAADAGVAQALLKMNNKILAEPTWDNSTLGLLAETDVHLPNSNADYSFNITGSPATGFTIVSTGTSGIRQRTIYATTRLKSVFDYTVLVKRNLVLYPNTSVIGYNSTTGEVGVPIQIGTASLEDDSIIILNNATVDGDVLVGVGGEPDDIINSKGVITGITDDLPQIVFFPEIDKPDLSDATPANLTIKGTTVTITGSGNYDSINLSQQATISGILEIDGTVQLYVTGDIELGQGCEIVIKNNGSSLELYLVGDMSAKEDAGINNETTIPGNFKLFGVGSEEQIIELKAKNDFYGAVYAPYADISIKAGGDIFGSFTGDNFEMKSKSVISGDAALLDVDINDTGVYFAINSWREE